MTQARAVSVKLLAGIKTIAQIEAGTVLRSFPRQTHQSLAVPWALGERTDTDFPLRPVQNIRADGFLRLHGGYQFSDVMYLSFDMLAYIQSILGNATTLQISTRRYRADNKAVFLTALLDNPESFDGGLRHEDGGWWATMRYRYGEQILLLTENAVTLDGSVDLRRDSGTPNDYLAQSFQIPATSDINKILLYLKKTGSPTGTLTFKLMSNSGSSPSSTVVATSDTLSEAALTTSYALQTITFPSLVELTANTSYWLRLETTRAAHAANYISWGTDGATEGYASGTMKGSQAASWVALNTDAIFTVNAYEMN